jgi:hypothetical protein
LRVLERVVGFGNFLELVLGLGVSRIAVRVILHGQLAIGGFEARRVAGLFNPEHGIEIGFAHETSLSLYRGRGRKWTDARSSLVPNQPFLS